MFGTEERWGLITRVDNEGGSGNGREGGKLGPVRILFSPFSLSSNTSHVL